MIWMTMLRKLCLWLVMLALPLQGLAAASMMHCAAQSPQRLEAAHTADHHSMQGISHPGHKHAEQAASSHSFADPAHHADPHVHKCVACAFCCHPVALNEAPQLAFGEAAHASPPEPSVLIQLRPVLVPDKPPRV